MGIRISTPSSQPERHAESYARQVSPSTRARHDRAGLRRESAGPSGAGGGIGARSSGKRLNPLASEAATAALGHDVSRTRIHSDDFAAAAAANIDARAFTLGHEIFVGAGEGDGSSGRLTGLLLHELAHAVQPDSGVARTVYRQPAHDAPALVTSDAPSPYEEEIRLLTQALEVARSGPPDPGTRIGPIAGVSGQFLGGSRLLVGPFSSDMGPIYYLYDFRGRDAKHAYVVRRSTIVPKNWSEPPTDQELDAAPARDTVRISAQSWLDRPGNQTKQGNWEREFRRDFADLAEVGGGGDPFSATTDPGMPTETGIRIPLLPGHTLRRRPYYQRKIAAFLAYQGFIHEAELVETGHDAAAANIAVALYQRTGRETPLRDDELNLDQYVGWSQRAVLARQGVQTALMLAELAKSSQAMARPGASGPKAPPPEPSVTSETPSGGTITPISSHPKYQFKPLPGAGGTAASGGGRTVAAFGPGGTALKVEPAIDVVPDPVPSPPVAAPVKASAGASPAPGNPVNPGIAVSPGHALAPALTSSSQPKPVVEKVADSNIFMDRPEGGPQQRAHIDALVLGRLDLMLHVPLSAIQEVHRVDPHGTQLARLLGRPGGASIGPDWDGDVTPYSTDLPKILSTKFGESDFRITLRAKERGIPVVTANRRLAAQVVDGNFPARVRALKGIAVEHIP
jgi:hypothetical protein